MTTREAMMIWQYVSIEEMMFLVGVSLFVGAGSTVSYMGLRNFIDRFPRIGRDNAEWCGFVTVTLFLIFLVGYVFCKRMRLL